MLKLLILENFFLTLLIIKKCYLSLHYFLKNTNIRFLKSILAFYYTFSIPKYSFKNILVTAFILHISCIIRVKFFKNTPCTLFFVAINNSLFIKSIIKVLSIIRTLKKYMNSIAITKIFLFKIFRYMFCNPNN